MKDSKRSLKAIFDILGSMDLNAREVAFVMEQMSKVEDSESSSPTERTEAERIRQKAQRRLIE